MIVLVLLLVVLITALVEERETHVTGVLFLLLLGGGLGRGGGLLGGRSGSSGRGGSGGGGTGLEQVRDADVLQSAGEEHGPVGLDLGTSSLDELVDIVGGHLSLLVVEDQSGVRAQQLVLLSLGKLRNFDRGHLS
jgi:hypothetical protein